MRLMVARESRSVAMETDWTVEIKWMLNRLSQEENLLGLGKFWNRTSVVSSGLLKSKVDFVKDFQAQLQSGEEMFCFHRKASIYFF